MFITIGREDWPCSHEIVAAVHGLVCTENLDKSLRENYHFSMVIESIRKFNHAVPFVPYKIHTVSGETYEVPHPDFISIAPRGHLSFSLIPRIVETSRTTSALC